MNSAAKRWVALAPLGFFASSSCSFLPSSSSLACLFAKILEPARVEFHAVLVVLADLGNDFSAVKQRQLPRGLQLRRRKKKEKEKEEQEENKNNRKKKNQARWDNEATLLSQAPVSISPPPLLLLLLFLLLLLSFFFFLPLVLLLH